jgi:hypothetical protein
MASKVKARSVLIVIVVVGIAVGGLVYGPVVLAKGKHGAGDRAIATRYLHAYQAQLVVERAALSVIQGNVDRYVAREHRRCREIVATVPKHAKDGALETAVVQESLDTVALATLQDVWSIDNERARAATEVVDETKWQQPVLAHLARVAENEQHALMMLGKPDLCRIAALWSEGNGDGLRKETQRFLNRWQAIERSSRIALLGQNVEALEATPIRQSIVRELRDYEPADERGLVRRVEAQETHLAERFTRIILDADEQMRQALV